MAGYQPPFTITNRMVGLVSEIAEKIGRLDRNKSLDMKPHLRRNNRIRSIHSSSPLKRTPCLLMLNTRSSVEKPFLARKRRSKRSRTRIRLTMRWANSIHFRSMS